MKILKPGKVEMRRFVCPNCGCEFLANEMDCEDGYVKCPQEGCDYNSKYSRGIPYEEPTEGANDKT